MCLQGGRGLCLLKYESISAKMEGLCKSSGIQ